MNSAVAVTLARLVIYVVEGYRDPDVTWVMAIQYLVV